MKTCTLQSLSSSIAAVERALRAPEQNSAEDIAAGRELLRKLKEKRRIMAYKAKSFTPSGRMIRH